MKVSVSHQTIIWRHFCWALFWLCCSLLSMSHHKPLGLMSYLYSGISLIIFYRKARSTFIALQYGLHQAKLKERQQTPTGIHGDSRFATYEETLANGNRDHNNGVVCGIDEHGLIFSKFTHSLVVSGAGGGKTVSVAIPSKSYGYRVAIDKDVSEAASCFVTDLKGELAVMTEKLSREIHGHEVYFLNPDKLHGLPNSKFNPLALVIQAIADAPNISNAKPLCESLVLQLLPEPKEADKNSFFRNGSRKILITVILWLAAEKPNQCTLTEVFRILSNIKSLTAFLEEAQSCTILCGEIALLASDILGSADEYLPDFLAGATQAVQCFGSSSPLSECVSDSDFSFDILKKKRVTIYLIVRYDRVKAYAPWIGLMTKVAIQSLVNTNGNIPVHFLLDEATNIPLYSLGEDLTALRGYGFRAQIIVKGKSEIRRVFGKESTETFYSQTDMKQFFGVTSLEEAREISAMIGSETIKSESLGADQTSPLSDLKNNISESGRPLIRPEELLSLAPDEQIILLRGMRPIRCKRLPYFQVSPFNKWLSPNPLEGGLIPPDPKVYLDFRRVK